MFNAYRRGPASFTRVLRAASSSYYVPSIRTHATPLALRNALPPVLGSRFIRLSSGLSQWATEAAEGYDESVYQDEEVQSSQGKNGGPLITRFDELIERNLVHPNVVETITKTMGHHTMTEVQTATINQGLEGTDIIAQARTGTGKTLGFLIPTIQNILKKSPELAERQRYTKARPSDIRAIIISPTRELAEQIAVEADKLCRNTDLRVQVAVGGNSKRQMLSKLQREGCHLLVATPGRLNDLLTDPYSRVSAPALNTIVLDEADRLLDSGFSKDIEDIIDLLPDRHVQDRQTLLFSATVPKEVMNLVRKTLKPDFHFVQTVKAGDLATHEKIPQKLAAVAGYENYMPTLLELCKREIRKSALEQHSHINAKPFKAIVYFSSTGNVELGSQIFENLKEEGGSGFGKHPLWPAEISQMHGQLSQQQRTRVSERFRRAKSAIMFSTDVTARGMDFPGVTHVIQMGLPPNRDQYVHRIGRTGRGDSTGEGWIILAKCDMLSARRTLRGLPIIADSSLGSSTVDMTRDAQLPASVAETLKQVAEATKMVDRRTKAAAYLSYLGQIPGGNPEQVCLALNQWTRFGWGWEEPPAVAPGLARKLNISNLYGMNIGYEEDGPRRSSQDRDQRNRGGFGGERSRGGFGGDRDGGSRGGFGGDRGRGGFGRDREGGERSTGGRGARGPAFAGQGRRDYGGRKSGYGDRDLASF